MHCGARASVLRKDRVSAHCGARASALQTGRVCHGGETELRDGEVREYHDTPDVRDLRNYGQQLPDARGGRRLLSTPRQS